jgi:hypothetical protein
MLVPVWPVPVWASVPALMSALIPALVPVWPVWVLVWLVWPILVQMLA